MIPLLSLWLPVVVAALIVFVVSSIIHMALGYHAGDWVGLPNEARFRDAFRNEEVPPGDYVVPYAPTAAERNSPAHIEKMKEGPVAFINVRPKGQVVMVAMLSQWFGYCLVVGFFAAYLGSRFFGPGADYMEVFRITGTVAFAGYGLALLQNSIWYGRKWSSTLKSVFDALVFALLTGGVFGWLWP
ncbi:MAG: hypothetical protein R2834_11960 [Rhodothermales bacterium]